MKKISFDKPKHSGIAYFFSALIVILVFLLGLCAVYGVYSFTQKFGIQSPVVFRSILYSKQKDILITPVATHGAKKQSGILNLGAIADKIYTLESSNGRNDSCRNLGLYNGYGFRQNTFEWICYNSHEEVRQHVINWLTQNIKEGNVEKALCLYNRGLNEQSCTYAMNYKSL